MDEQTALVISHLGIESDGGSTSVSTDGAVVRLGDDDYTSFSSYSFSLPLQIRDAFTFKAGYSCLTGETPQ